MAACRRWRSCGDGVVVEFFYHGREHQADSDRIRRALADEPQTQTPEASESELIRVRREKLDRIAALGYDRFPTTADVDTTIEELVARYGGKTHDELEAQAPRVKIAGRIMTVPEV